MTRNSTLLRAAGLAPLLTLSSAAAVSLNIGGQVRNPAAASALGAGQVTVLMTNLGQGWLLGLGPLSGARFSINVPDTFRPPVQPLDVCSGVSVSPRGARTYTAETLLAFNPRTNAAATLVQADDPVTPTRRGQWIYSDRTVTVRGRCDGLNTYYHLTLRQGWTGVTTESRDGRFDIMNAKSNLPYWIQPVLTRTARQTFPVLFSGQRSAFGISAK